MTLRLAKLAFVVSFCYLITAALWKPLFLVGSLPGLYWLFIAIDYSPLLTPALGALMFATSSVVLILRKTDKLKPLLLVVKYGLACLSILATIVICGWILLFSFAQHGRHVQTLTLPFQTYQLAVYPMFDLNYVLFECDHSSIVCTEMYRSGDYMQSEAHLALDDGHQYVDVVVSDPQGDQVIYRQPVKQP